MLDRLFAIPPAFYTSDRRRISVFGYAFLLMLCVAFFTPGLATMPPTDRDESLFAQASKQMVESGDYLDIRVQDQPRYKKPVGIYWLQSAAVRAFAAGHHNEIWAYRLPSLAGATIAVLMTAALGALLFNPATGLLAAMMLAGCVLMNVEARLATTDAALLACVVCAMYGLAKAKGSAFSIQHSGSVLTSPDPRRLKAECFLFWTALAIGILLKGPIVLLPVGGVLLWLRIADKNVAWFGALRPVVGVIYLLLLTAPWFALIALHSHGAFFQQSAGSDMLAKIWQGQNRGVLPPGLHLTALPVLFFPFSLFVALAIPDVWAARRDDAVKFCLGWLVPTWVVFELALTKLPHYELPTYPALALLAAKFLHDGFPALTASRRRLTLGLTIGVWVMIGAGFAVVFALLPNFADGGWLWPQVAAGVVLILSQFAALLLLPKRKIQSLCALTIGGLIFMTATFGDTMPNIRHIWMSRQIVAAADRIAPCPGYHIIATGYHEPSLVFMAGTDTVLAAGGAAAAAALREDRCSVAVIDPHARPDFLDAFKDQPRQPVESGNIDGLNAGHGARAVLTLYLLPPSAP